MQMRTIATLAIAVFLGLIAVVLTQNWLTQQRQSDLRTAAFASTVPVVVAAQPIARGVTLNASLLKVARYPQGSVPPGAFASIQDATSGGARMALRPMSANEPVLAGRVTAPGGKANMSAAMTPGMRAVSFRSNDVAGVAGFVLPGDRVDVLLTRSAGADQNVTTLTQAVAENIRVLGVDQSDDEAANKPQVAKAITIEVTPEQAQAISLAQAVGQVSLALRQIGDEAPLTRQVTRVSDLGGLAPRAAPTPSRPTVRRVAVRGPSGGQVQVTRGITTTGYSVAVR
ncbi:MAG: Flp pilus assembly protein CpaB [Phenylobacterium sp.]|uniref:Flp pilus assembly protein CpaB n=1 Tax=Phenylobacterium sp. TaxID=1871053 RepID=UPI00273727CF|nr:Flp pilus assembly protein CpaB [Phenylobacterium sp.]MDP3173177.1 Flp pilus assembly protein CpaB [Phenylobacterium sp.]